MRTLLNSIPKKIYIAEVLLCILLSLVRAFGLWSRPAAWINLVVFVPASVLVLVHLLGPNAEPHMISVVIWTLLVCVLLGPMGILGSISIWYLTFHKSFNSQARWKGTVLLEIQPVFPIPFCKVPIPWRKYMVIQYQSAYHLVNAFMGTDDPINVHLLYKPDLNRGVLNGRLSQFLDLDCVTAIESEEKWIRFWLPHGEGFKAIQDLDVLITKACKANDVKRVTGTMPTPCRRRRRRSKKEKK